MNLIYKINSWIKKIIKYFRDFIRTGAGKFIILSLIILVGSIPLVLMVLGFDSLFIKSSLNGTVYSQSGEVVPGVELKIQDKTTTTDSNGRYNIEGLDYGRWNMVLTGNGYEEYAEEVILQRFSNKRDFYIVPLDFGIVEGTLIANSEIDTSELSVFINESELMVNSDNKFTSERLIVGQYNLKIESSNYIDIEREITIMSGISQMQPIFLEEGSDLEIEIIDYLSEETLSDYELKLTNIEYVIDENGITTIRDIPTKQTLSPTIEKNDYITKTVEIEPEQGKNAVQIALVKNQKVISSKNGNVFHHYINGSEATNLTPGLSSCEIIYNIQPDIVVNCFGGIYKTRTDSPTPQVLQLGYNIENSTYTSQGLIFQAVDNKLILLNSDSSTTELQEFENQIVEIDTLEDNNLLITTSTGIYIYNFNEDAEAREIITGSYSVQDLKDSNTILALNYTEPTRTRSHITEIDIDGTRNQITITPDEYKQLSYTNKLDEIYAVVGPANSLEKINLDSLNSNTISEDALNIIQNNNLLTVSTTRGVLVVDEDLNTKIITL